MQHAKVGAGAESHPSQVDESNQTTPRLTGEFNAQGSPGKTVRSMIELWLERDRSATESLQLGRKKAKDFNRE